MIMSSGDSTPAISAKNAARQKTSHHVLKSSPVCHIDLLPFDTKSPDILRVVEPLWWVLVIMLRGIVMLIAITMSYQQGKRRQRNTTAGTICHKEKMKQTKEI
jgi:hypothetical protein